MLAWFGRRKAKALVSLPEWNPRNACRDLGEGRRLAVEVLPEFAEHQSNWHVAALSNGPSSALWVDTKGGRCAVLFTDLEAARSFVWPNTPLQEMAGYPLLLALQRDGYKGLLINPGSDQLLLDHTHLRLLFREYALRRAQTTPLWAPTRDGSLLAVEMAIQGVMAVPIYLDKTDASHVGEPLGGDVSEVTWEQVRERCREVVADAVLLQHGKPEEVPLSRRQLANLCPDGAAVDALDAVDVALQVSGHERVAAVCEALARCERIWVVADRDGDVVSLANVFDLFTSATDATVLVRRLGLSEQVIPMLLPARALFESLAPKGLPVAVNRGSSASWQGDERALSAIATLSQRVPQ